ncbi:hypothetical protein BDV38DRAFT_240969 [Aspergillus pseudotamarii]|uniref:Exonuclease domain-containing protein n=1 Tax=Aspergillus pseudotamarii TaxID=132259 RepID=A0A5N6T0W0_ASPPS|nr:uncharacterized protein BDV38DRAFT_240969 [Aspergillus pseudotamarii]KAE8140087.1 hypothetical protein BDV38DRAFT_240969 [Aspergillus pseudotamarii]
MEEFMKAISSYVSGKHEMMVTNFLRCYGGLKTKGETPLQIRDKSISVSGHDAEDMKILSWFTTQEMQCLLRILEGCDKLIQNKISHKAHKNFQPINVGDICKKPFSGLPARTLETVHEFLSGREGPCGEYRNHTASYDTEAMAAIVKYLVQLK